MPIRRVVASLLACAVGLVAAEVDDVTMTYTYEETAAGRDIHEGIYGSHGAGEFDEWRLHLGLAPAIDRVQLKTNINGNPYPGPGAVETDLVVSALSPQIGLVWVLGDYEGGDHGWFSTLGFEFTRREYKILYGLGVASVPLDLNSLTAHFGMGYAWYLGSRLRYEFEPFVNAGMMWTDLDLIDLSTSTPDIQLSGGPQIEAGIRNALIWHPARTQAWHLGAALDYRTAYAQTMYDGSGEAGDIRSEVRFWWYGFSASLFYGAKF